MKPAQEKALVESYNLFAASRPHAAAHGRNRRAELHDLTAIRLSSDRAMFARWRSASTLLRFSGHPFVQRSSRARPKLAHSAGLSAAPAAPILEQNRDCRLARPIPVARVE